MKRGDLVMTQDSAINGAIGTIIRSDYAYVQSLGVDIEGFVVYFHTNAYRWTGEYRLVPKEKLKKVEVFS